MLRCNMTHTWLSVLTISVLIVLNLGQENVPRNGELRAMLRQCKNTTSSSETISECVIKGLDVLRDIFEFGDIDVNLPSIDPQPLLDVHIQEGTTGQVNMNCLCTNVTLMGTSEYEFTELKIDYTAKTLYLRFLLPKVRMNSLYKLSGNIWIIPITGEGTSWIKLDDVDVLIESNMEIDGNTIHFNYTHFDFNYGKVIMRLNNLYAADPILSATVNGFMNENSKDIVDGVKPQLLKQMSDIFENIQNQVFAALGTEDIPGIELIM